MTTGGAFKQTFPQGIKLNLFKDLFLFVLLSQVLLALAAAPAALAVRAALPTQALATLAAPLVDTILFAFVLLFLLVIMARDLPALVANHNTRALAPNARLNVPPPKLNELNEREVS